MLQLIPAKDSDYEYVRNVHHTSYKDMVIKQFGKWEEHVQDRFFHNSWNTLSFEIINFEGEACGFCSIEENKSTLQLREFAIDISKQGLGIGSKLLTKLKEMGVEKRKKVQLNVMKTNKDGRKLYEKLGFSVYGENHFQFLMHIEAN
jgi:ribosomal protein S18 acetylase RimI-like enzyme